MVLFTWFKKQGNIYALLGEEWSVSAKIENVS